VVFHRPQRLHAELDGEIAQPELLAVHLLVAQRVEGVLERSRVSDVHVIPLELAAVPAA
jgi:hypothetical protein